MDKRQKNAPRSRGRTVPKHQARGWIMGTGSAVLVVVLIILVVRTRSLSTPPVPAIKSSVPTATSAQVLSGPVRGKVGEHVVANGQALTVQTTTRTATFGTYLEAKPDIIYVVADVVLGNVERRVPVPFNRLYFTATDLAGTLYTVEPTGAPDELHSGSLSQGQDVRGSIAFAVPQTTRQLTLTYAIIGPDAPAPIQIVLDSP